MRITIWLSDREQNLLLANELNDHPSWHSIAVKIRQAQQQEAVRQGPGRWPGYGDEGLRELLRLHESGSLGLEDQTVASIQAEIARRAQS